LWSGNGWHGTSQTPFDQRRKREVTVQALHRRRIWRCSCFSVVGTMRAVALLVLTAVLTASPTVNPFAFFSPSVVLSDQERARLAAGEVVSRVLPAAGHDVALLAAVPVNVNGDRLVAWVRDISHLKRSLFVPLSRRFSDPPALDDLRELVLDDRDLDAIRACRPGGCGVKLAASEIAQLQSGLDEAGENWKTVVQDRFRQVVLSRVQTYLAEGDRGFPALNDPHVPVSRQAGFSALVRRWAFLAVRMPELVDYLDRYPEASRPDIESFLYWSREQFGSRPVVTVTHVAIIRGRGDQEPEVLIAGKQILATHYMDASLGLTALVRGAQSHYLVYLNRSDIDMLGGFWGGLIRVIVERRLRAEAPATLSGLRDRLESGDPPGVAADVGGR
jgi:hypothetical protein